MSNPGILSPLATESPCCDGTLEATPQPAAGDSTPRPCPECDALGRATPLATITSMRRSMRPIPADRVREAEAPWRACLSSACPVAYYGASATISVTEVSATVHHKARSPDPLICFCFEYRISALERSMHGTHSVNPIVLEIQSRCREGLGQCQIKNPEGRCCLRNIAQVLKTETSTSQGRDSPVGGGSL